MAIRSWYVRVGIFLDDLQSTKFSHFLKLIGEKYLYTLIQKNFLKEICRIQFVERPNLIIEISRKRTSGLQWNI